MQYLVEHLPRIGSTSVVVHGGGAPIVASLNSSTLKLKTDSGYSVSILLPHEVDLKGPYSFVPVGNSDYVLRLNSKEDDIVEYRRINKSQNILMLLPDGKWTKKHLLGLSSFKISCLNCDFDIIDEENCSKLNEMPSEFWMELMDYWHCHKPHHPTEKTAVYSAKHNSLNPLTKEILVGGSFFLANEETFKGRLVCKGSRLCCVRCSASLGKKTKDQLFKIYKYKTKLLSDGGSNIDIFPPENDVVITLLNHVKGNSTRYVLLKCDKIQVLVWMFAIGIDVTFSNGRVMNNCIKILYRDDAAPEVKRKQNVDDAEVDLLPMESFLDVLEQINKLLPQNNKKMGTWNVSYIPVIN